MFPTLPPHKVCSTSTITQDLTRNLQKTFLKGAVLKTNATLYLGIIIKTIDPSIFVNHPEFASQIIHQFSRGREAVAIIRSNNDDALFSDRATALAEEGGEFLNAMNHASALNAD
jgi:hypothetical protein